MNIKQVIPFQANPFQSQFPNKGNNHSNNNNIQFIFNQPSFFNNSSIPITSKFVSNVNKIPQISMREKAATFGQDRDENYFRRSLRKMTDSSAIKSTYYNIVQNNRILSKEALNSRDKNLSFISSHSQQLSTINHLANIIKGEERELRSNRGTKYKTNPSIPSTKQNNHQAKNTQIENIKNSDQKEYYKQHCSAINEYAYYQDANYYYRQYMEDKGHGIDTFNNIPSDALFCLYDGHGGGQVSQFLRDNLAEKFKTMLPSKDILSSLNELFANIDNQIRLLGYYNVGSTACVVYITKESNRKVVYCANVGDTRCVLVSKNRFKRLSYDHRPSDKNEYERVIKAGGMVYEGRVYGQLMLSRCFGDFELKPYGVISTPDITRTEIGNDDEYIVIASDGIWDVLEDEEVFLLSKEVANSNDFVHLIAKTAFMKGTMDNMSCFVIKI